MKLFRFLSRRCSAGSWRHQDDTGTVAPRKPTSSWAPADRKALARSRLIEWQGFVPNVGGATAPERPKREFNYPSRMSQLSMPHPRSFRDRRKARATVRRAPPVRDEPRRPQRPLHHGAHYRGGEFCVLLGRWPAAMAARIWVASSAASRRRNSRRSAATSASAARPPACCGPALPQGADRECLDRRRERRQRGGG
jgi:hypothetical protein